MRPLGFVLFIVLVTTWGFPVRAFTGGLLPCGLGNGLRGRAGVVIAEVKGGTVFAAPGKIMCRQTRSTLCMSGALSNEDEWYDSEKWQNFGKSKAREFGTKKSTDQEREQERREEREGEVGAEVEWLRAGGCDVCLPKDRRKPLDGTRRFNAVVHFVGGVFVGSIPKQAYKPLIEGIVQKGRVIIIATPCAALSGMDHYKAAYEAAFKFNSACTELEGQLGSDVFETGEVPVVGVGHSLGCKVHVLLNSLREARQAAGRERAANVFMAFNNFGAKQSIPVLSELNEIQKSFQTGLASVAPFFEKVSGFADQLGKNKELRDLIGEEAAGRASQFLDVLQKVGMAASNAQSSVSEEFSPDPSETLRLVTQDYTTSRNLAVKFLDDTIDQSIDLCQLLRAKFTDKVTGQGGRLDLKRLPGSHITPNTPDLADLVKGNASSDQLGEIGEFGKRKAKEVTGEMDALCDVVVKFVLEEAELDWMLPKGKIKLPRGT